MAENDLRRQFELLQLRNDRESAKSLGDYLNRVVVDCSPEPRPFGEIAESWQKLNSMRLTPIIETVSGHRTDYTGPMLAWEGMPKGHNKSSGLASMLNWLVAYAKKTGLRAYCTAKDSDQASVIRDFMFKLAELNPWIRKKLEFKTKSVHGKDNGAILEILAADASGSQGKLADCIICDELTAWQDKGKEMWDALFTSVGKRVVHGKMHCACIVLTNAGYKRSWQEELRDRAASSAMWSFFEAPPGRTLASWQTPAIIEELRKEVSPSEARRLYDNCWIDLTEERGAFRPDDILACVGKPLPVPPGGTAVISIDFGGVFDRTALGVVWWDGQKVHVPELQAWQGTPKDEIQVSAVAKWIDKKLKQYPKAVVVFDVHQLLSEVQRLEKAGVNVVRYNYQGGKANVTMLQHLRTLLTNKKIVYDDNAGYLNGETLVDELMTVITKTLRFGERFDHEPGLHDDRTACLGMACMEAVKYPPVKPMSLGKTPPQQPQRDSGSSIFSQDHLSRRGLFGTR